MSLSNKASKYVFKTNKSTLLVARESRKQMKRFESAPIGVIDEVSKTGPIDNEGTDENSPQQVSSFIDPKSVKDIFSPYFGESVSDDLLSVVPKTR